jgi:hypothetical protein
MLSSSATATQSYQRKPFQTPDSVTRTHICDCYVNSSGSVNRAWRANCNANQHENTCLCSGPACRSKKWRFPPLHLAFCQIGRFLNWHLEGKAWRSGKLQHTESFPSRIVPLQPLYCPGVYSASNTCEFQKIFVGVERGLCARLTTTPTSVSRLSRNCGILNNHNPIGLHSMLQGGLYFFTFFYKYNNKKKPQRFGDCICFRLQVRGRRRLLSWVPYEELTSVTGQPMLCNNSYIRSTHPGVRFLCSCCCIA